ncbi:MAG TPA: DUF4837 family protein [Longimicrobiaceae bacterium]
MPSTARAVALLLTGSVLAGCDLPAAVGDHSRIMVAVDDATWHEVGASIVEALEPSRFTVREERIFDVAHVDPATSEDWADFRKLRQVLVIGEAADPWVATALKKVGDRVPRGPEILVARNVWARPQTVTILLLPPGSQAAEAAAVMPEVGALYLRQLEEYSLARMFVSGEQTELADSLARIAGFSLRVPAVYRVTEPEVGVFVFRNDQPDPSDLIRQVTVTRRPWDEVESTPRAVIGWRAELAARTTTPPQVTADSALVTRIGIEVGGNPALEVQTTWSNPPGSWPAGGPVITRLVRCGEYAYLTDGWLYAPGRPKYQYMIQLEALLDSFRCA